MQTNTTEQAKTVAINLFLPEDIHMSLKLKATVEKVTMSTVVIDALTALLAKKSKVRNASA